MQKDQFSVVFVEITAEGSTFDNYQLKLIEIRGNSGLRSLMSFELNC